MTGNRIDRKKLEPSWLVSALIFVAAVAVMSWIRLVLLHDRFITITDGLPLLLCLWHRDRRLLWAMAATFVGMSVYKAWFLLPSPHTEWHLLQWVMQVLNTVVIAGVVDVVLRLLHRLELRNRDLQAANEELAQREEEIGRQNEELQAQSEELAQQNEELQHQSEELQQQSEELQSQSEELQSQSEELQSANDELTQREQMLQTLLESVRFATADGTVLEQICRSTIELFRGSAAGAVVLCKSGEQLVVRAAAGAVSNDAPPLESRQAFAGVVIQQNRTAFVEDLDSRADLLVASASGERRFRTVVSTPLRLDGEAIGVVEVYSFVPRRWTRNDFRVVEWIASQCALILEVHKVHETLAQTNANLEKIVQDRTARLQEMVGELEHFSYSITHDMRAPLRALQGFSELLASGELDDSQRRDYLNRIITAASRMDRLITDALSYSRSVRQQLPLKPVDARELLVGMLQSYPEFQAPGARIELAPHLPTVLANEAGLTQCFSNLLNNAIKFVDPERQPVVRIRGEQVDDVARIWFEDNGIGIPQELAPRMFGMFQRGSRQYEGNGIGLALVRKVTERMGGRVGVESQPGEGSRFWIELKACSQPAHAKSHLA